ncbi:hypothetical protein BDV30DRAFT_155653 [Aspergillus minisclerotigenes]|uniref:Uncharacterized protein n=1 Tax=Aspergillus minisclerotigenes TaxID=656917 RepID=A0A5N6JGV5_9EURO|nr:hypothetical protein BDV30DRAFT_155653 [Aspergillus minisclerotigenes]
MVNMKRSWSSPYSNRLSRHTRDCTSQPGNDDPPGNSALFVSRPSGFGFHVLFGNSTDNVGSGGWYQAEALGRIILTVRYFPVNCGRAFRLKMSTG